MENNDFEEIDNLDDSSVYLIFGNKVGLMEDGRTMYELIFSDNPDECWGEGFEEVPSSIINNLQPDEKYKTETHRIITDVPLALAQDNSCFGMQDVIDGVLSLIYEDLSQEETYPDDTGRLVLHFGESYDEVERKLALRGILMSN